MALAFELVVNYGRDRRAAAEACRVAAAHPPLRAGTHDVLLHPPLQREVSARDGGRYLEISVLPVAVGCNVALDRHRPQLSLTLEELNELGNGLYALLSQFQGYLAAQVGWDPEPFVDIGELRHEWLAELTRGDLSGLVLSEDIHRSFPEAAGFQQFSPGFKWIPYEGEHRTWRARRLG